MFLPFSAYLATAPDMQTSLFTCMTAISRRPALILLGSDAPQALPAAIVAFSREHSWHHVLAVALAFRVAQLPFEMSRTWECRLC